MQATAELSRAHCFLAQETVFRSWRDPAAANCRKTAQKSVPMPERPWQDWQTFDDCCCNYDEAGCALRILAAKTKAVAKMCFIFRCRWLQGHTTIEDHSIPFSECSGFHVALVLIVPSAGRSLLHLPTLFCQMPQ